MIRTLIIILVFTLEFDHATILPSFAPYLHCPDGSFQGINPQDCFSYHNVSAQWYDAYITCLNNDGILASIHDTFTNALIKQHLSNFTNQQTWTGGQVNAVCDFSRCSYYWGWEDNSVFDYNNFAGGYPDPTEGEVISFNNNDGLWYVSSDGTQENPFLCKVSAKLSF
uniref:C-type lectin domain-containing protein n=1 Tax=Acrobeloides nanus TaxID=290746 RepID=A0A914DEN4_9BILA